MLTFIKNLRHEDHKKALMATLVFIMLMILFFLLSSLEYPDPPPQEKVVEVEIEFPSGSEGGGALAELLKNIPEPKPESAIERDIQEEETVVVATSKGKSETSVKEVVSKPTKDPVPQPDSDFKFDPGKSTKPGNNGANFGKNNGVKDGGKGPNSGIGNYKKNRTLLSAGSVPGNSQEEGNVALDIYVNEFGKVVRTEINESLTTNRSTYLIDLAKKYANLRKYENDPGAPTFKVETKVYNFRKQ